MWLVFQDALSPGGFKIASALAQAWNWDSQSIVSEETMVVWAAEGGRGVGRKNKVKRPFCPELLYYFIQNVKGLFAKSYKCKPQNVWAMPYALKNWSLLIKTRLQI